jgi:TolB-like protein
MDEFRSDIGSVTKGLKPLKAKRRPGKKIFGLDARYAVPAALLIVLSLGLGFNLGGVRDKLFGGAAAPARAVKLAVLPFVNLSGDPDEEFFTDGITEEMIIQLGRLHPDGLSVIARTSVTRYKKRETPLEQIGRELDVAYVLDGSALREANQVQITAELIRIEDQEKLWTKAYERELSDILILQSDVARNVARALAFKLLPNEEARLASARTVDPEAFEAYHKGEYHWKSLLGPISIPQKNTLGLQWRKIPPMRRLMPALAAFGVGVNKWVSFIPRKTDPNMKKGFSGLSLWMRTLLRRIGHWQST